MRTTPNNLYILQNNFMKLLKKLLAALGFIVIDELDGV